MTGGDHEPETEPTDDEPLTVVADEAVIDLRDGVDTLAAYEADQADRAAKTRRG